MKTSPEEDNGGSGDGSGMSRAAKKRAKKKNKNKSPSSNKVETSQEEGPKKRTLGEIMKPTVEESKMAGVGILKKSKYNNNNNNRNSSLQAAKTSRKNKHDPMLKVDDDDNCNDNDGDEGCDEVMEVNDIVISDDIQDLIKSGEMNLKDILLLEDHAKSNGNKKTAAKKNDEEESMTNESLFQQLTSKERARCALNFILAPADLTADDFYEEYWEKKALCIQVPQQHRRRFQGFLSLNSIKQLTDKHVLQYGRDLNVTKYHTVQPGQPKRRANLDPPPYQDSRTGETRFVEADSSFIWDHYENSKATIRLLCPHKQNDSVHALLSLLELEWGCMVGANAYLTPPGGAQGFAPHYDDIEAFCLQLEGRKRWKVYAPDKKARLPRASSEDFTDEDMQDREPVLDVVLEPGDMLYMPRGWIHHGVTLPTSQGNEHSLHLTVSAMQQWAWVDYLELLIPEALEAAANSETSVSLRTGLPRNFLDYMGAMHDQREDDNLPDRLKVDAKLEAKSAEEENSEADSDEQEVVQRKRMKLLQERFRADAKKKIMRVAKEAMDMVDAACDQIGKRFLSDRLPPGLTPEEIACTSEGNNDTKIWPTTLCRIARPGIARLVLEDGKAVLYHCNDNSRVYHEVPLSPMEFEVDDAPALEQLVTTVEPHWIPVSDLIHESMEEKIAITQSLYDEGILAIVNH